MRTVAYAFVTPVFFIIGGMKMSVSMIIASLGLFAVLFGVKIVTKFAGVFFPAKRYIPHGSMYTTLLMSTDKTFGTIASVFGSAAKIIDRVRCQVLFFCGTRYAPQ